MSASVRFYDVVLWIHISAVVLAFGALFAYPLFLTVNARAPLTERAQLHRLQIAFSKYVTGPTIGVILAAGAYMASEARLWSRAWVIVPVVLLAVIAGLGITVLRRGEERLLESAETGDEAAYDAAFVALRAWTLLTVALIVVTVFFMAAKP
jgi:hypothetical protein